MPFNTGTRESRLERLQDAKAYIDPLIGHFPEYGDFDFYYVYLGHGQRSAPKAGNAELS